MNAADLSALLPGVRLAALAAGRAILDIYATDFAVREKDDESPVTEADERAERIILAALAELAPDIPAVAEEAAAAGRLPRLDTPLFWLVDPLDGTKEFIKRNGEFTVNIGLIHGDRPVLGAVYAPVIDALYLAAGPGTAVAETGGIVRPIAARTPPAEGLTIIDSRSHGDARALRRWLAGRAVAHRTVAGSSLKFCRVAEGAADVYPRFGPTSEWDTAAGHAVLLAAGGGVVTLEGEDLRYRKAGYLNPSFVALGRAA